MLDWLTSMDQICDSRCTKLIVAVITVIGRIEFGFNVYDKTLNLERYETCIKIL